MIGGETDVVKRLDPIFATLAPRADGRSRARPDASGEPAPPKQGYLHCGPHGAGHFVKMVHNGIEYGLMAAYAEGLNILRHANVGKQTHTADAETTPLRDPEYYQYDFDLARRRRGVAARQRHRLVAARPDGGRARRRSRSSTASAGRVSDSGEGRWTLDAAIDEAVPAHVLHAALFERFSSRGEAEFQDRVLSAMRFEFGGHKEKGIGNMSPPLRRARLLRRAPATSRTRRSSRRCTRWRGAATSTSRSSASRGRVGRSTT